MEDLLESEAFAFWVNMERVTNNCGKTENYSPLFSKIRSYTIKKMNTILRFEE